VRVSTVPTVNGESMALRLLDLNQGAGSLAALAMPQDVREAYRWGLAQRSGLIVVTGPTGSGKTTTLHALLCELNAIDRKIITVENPVEIRIPGVVQVEANPEIGLTFATALRTFLRQDPDVIMVGEIRDLETARVAIQAALTGHIVLSTLHTNDAATAVPRLVDMGLEPYMVAATLKLAGAQRLVRRLCQACAEPLPVDHPDWHLARRHAARLPRGPWQLKTARGCMQCNQTGYAGRRAVFEALGGDALKAIARGEPNPCHTLFQHGLALATAGQTTVDEILRVLDAVAP
jgi:general secretion pathway protein E